MIICKLCGYTRTVSDTAPEYECPNCGAVYAKVEAKLQREEEKKRQQAEQLEREAQQKLELQKQEEIQKRELDRINRAKNKVLIKTYVGKQDKAMLLFQKEADELAAQYYYPTSQSFAPGSHSTQSYVVAFILLGFAGIGIFLLGYMLLIKPPGTLTVTYTYMPD